MKHSRSWIIIGSTSALLSLTGACSNIRSESYWGPAQKFSGLGDSFAWKQGGKCEPDADRVWAPEIGAVLQELVESNLTEKGYDRLTEGAPDFSVCYRLGKVVAQARTGLESWDEAIFEVDLSNPANSGIIWRGRVQARIDYSVLPEVRLDRLEAAVKQLLKPLPKADR